MKKKGTKSRKAQQKKREIILIGVVIGLLFLAAVLGIIDAVTGGSRAGGYTVTEDGHIHAADGTHIGTVEELFGEQGGNVVIDEEGHIHIVDDSADADASGAQGDAAEGSEGDAAEDSNGEAENSDEE